MENIKVGDRVIRKNYGGGTGIVERISTFRHGKKKAYVRWINALNLFHSGLTDSHSTVVLSSLLIENEVNLAKQQKSKTCRQLKWAKERWEMNKDWVYCSQCKARITAATLTCYRCGPITEVDRWTDSSSAKEIKLIIEKGV